MSYTSHTDRPSGIAVFCSASEGLPQEYTEAARLVGNLIARMGCNLVYGGSRSGLMEHLARATTEAGGRAVGVIPLYLVNKGMESTLCTAVHYCTTLSERKEIMMSQSRACIALPGGIGTLDETFTVLASDQIGERRLPMILYNVSGFFDPLIDLLRHLDEKGVGRNAAKRVKVAESIEELEEYLREC